MSSERILKFQSLIPGISAVGLILLILGTALIALWGFAIRTDNISIYFDHYLLHIIWVTVLQAGLSTCLAIILAVLMAKALAMVDFPCQGLLIKIMPVTFILPTLVVVTGLLSVYGQHGIVSLIFQFLNLPIELSIYGLKGILLAHVFLNFPYACCLFHQSLKSVPIEQKQLAAQLNFSAFTFFKLVEWPLLRRQILPMAALIFMLCFSSFAIVLALGGGPKYTTIEVAIYQSIRDFDLIQAVLLSFLQLICCIGFLIIMQRINRIKKMHIRFVHQTYQVPIPYYLSLISYVIILIGSLFILLPLVTILIEGIYFFKFALLTAALLKALLTSIIIAVGSAFIAMFLALLLLWTNSRLLINQQIKWSNRLMLIGSLILAIPSMVLASGLFLLLFQYANNIIIISILVMLCNALMALPFLLKNLSIPMYEVSLRYWQLCQSLNIQGLTHFYLIEFKALKKLMVMSFAFAVILSFGDFGVIALFGGQALTTLPYYLYEQISHYHYQEGTVTAAILLMLSFSLMVVMDYDRT